MAAAVAIAPAPQAAPAAPAPHRPAHKLSAAPARPRPESGDQVVTRLVHELIAVMPGWVKVVIAALAALALMLGVGAGLVALNNRRVERARALLADDLDALGSAVIPDVPKRVGGLLTSVARRSKAHVALGGSFFDVFALEAGRVGLLLGGVTGDGADAAASSTRLHHTLRALLEAEAVPRRALQTADRLVGGDLADMRATAVVAVHDRRRGTLTYASAGHTPPVLVGPPEHLPVRAAEATPIGAGGRAGARQTTISFPSGSVACFFTPGMAELGYDQLVALIEDLGPLATASRVADAVADAANAAPDDLVTCLLRPVGAKAGPSRRIEELELTPDEVDAQVAADFMRGCGIGEFTLERYDSLAQRTARRYGGATGVILRVHLGAEQQSVEVLVAGREWPYAPAPPPAALVG